MRSKSPRRSDVCARCPAAGSIRQALNRAIRLVFTEFSFLGDRSPFRFRGSNCSQLRTEWDGRKAALLEGLQEEHFRVLKQTLKSCNRFFDVPCSPCDRKAAKVAVESWRQHVGQDPNFDPASPASWGNEPIEELALRIRRILGPDWAGESPRNGVYVPDVNGCLEVTRVEGGTLAAGDVPLSYNLRVGCAKTNGKHRVVTMQSARVKEILKPVHERLYDFLSRRKWLVRGDVTKDHVRGLVSQRSEGEDIVSGDYKAATDNIYLSSVQTIVSVIGESPSLTALERKTLLESFAPENLNWTSRSGKLRPIKRGSMMGNLMSFNVLCLLNKACFDIVSSLRRKRGDIKGYRYPLINGDDIAFTGDSAAYEDWVSVTGHFGFVVNREKTGVSPIYLELNSRSFRVSRLSHGSYVVRALRKPVLSALLPGAVPSDLLSRLWEGLRTMSPASFRVILVCLRHQIARREVSLSAIPVRLRKTLMKEAWFRTKLLLGECVHERGVKRSQNVISKGVRPPEEMLPLYEEMCIDRTVYTVNRFRGKRFPDSCIERHRTGLMPYEKLVCFCKRSMKTCRYRLGMRSTWVWRWPEDVFILWDEMGLPLRDLSDNLWEDDHPHLATKVEAYILPTLYPPPAVLQVGVETSGVISWPNGLV